MTTIESIGVILVASGLAHLIVLYRIRQESIQLSFNRTDDGSLFIIPQIIDYRSIISRWIVVLLSFSIFIALGGYLLDGFTGFVIMLIPVITVVLPAIVEIPKLKIEPIDRFEQTLASIESIDAAHSNVFQKQLEHHIESIIKTDEEKLALLHHLSHRDDAIGKYASEKLNQE